ncbi:GATA transcription factor 9-like [Bidens hawaiensis]|uniref:GATA transcription factor 9-like n=1 Tax=Bidens hawaiensis TaxID=980011 RepID=UPI00404B7A70
MDFYSHANNNYNQRFTSEKHHSPDTKTDHFVVDDLLDFPTDDVGVDFVTDTSTDSSTVVDSSNSSSQCGVTEPYLVGDHACRSFVDNQFSNLCTPYDDLAEFEWLSNFVEESFSNEDVQKLELLSEFKARPVHKPETHCIKPMSVINRTNNSIFNYDMTIPGKARTKRSRATSHNWASRVPVMYPNVTKPVSNMSTNCKPINTVSNSKNDEGRKCFHCATSKTPQWRTGPMGPRTLCNACGVRYKSGRLVPEYRPAASPTFVLTKHSNSHRKVLELRRQKMQKTMNHQQQFVNHQDVMLQIPNADNYYFIHHP